MLLVAYGGAMWMFLSSAPKVYTIMVSDLQVAREFYEGLLNLSAADVPLHYYYNYEQAMGAGGLDQMYLAGTPRTPGFDGNDGIWYQLKKNTQLHVISGASRGDRDRPLNFLVKDIEQRTIEMAEVSN